MRLGQDMAVLTAIANVIVSVACNRSSIDDGLSETQDCSACHGNSGNAAPPKAVNGATSPSDIRVGAHQAHMLGSDIAGPVNCSDCHPLPSDYLTHPRFEGGPASVQFSGRAIAGGAQPVWDRNLVTCKNSYCHGATLSGAETRQAPIWTEVDGSQRRCTSCHGFPPSGTHPAGGACESCHGDVAGPSGSIKNPKRHVDGIIDVSSSGTSRLDCTRARPGSTNRRREVTL
ncbi:MAG TPA: CxxxxCH/CxxCH domain-containing protein [Polyangiaceae bacterium]